MAHVSGNIFFQRPVHYEDRSIPEIVSGSITMALFLGLPLFFYMQGQWKQGRGKKQQTPLQSKSVSSRIRAIMVAFVLMTMANYGLITILQSVTVLNTPQFMAFGLLRLFVTGAGFIGYLLFDFIVYHSSGEGHLNELQSLLDYVKGLRRPGMDAEALIAEADTQLKHIDKRINSKHLQQEVSTVYSIAMLHAFVAWVWGVLVVMDVDGIQLAFLLLISSFTVLYALWGHPLEHIPSYSQLGALVFLVSFIISLLLRFDTAGMTESTYITISVFDILYATGLAVAMTPFVREFYESQ